MYSETTESIPMAPSPHISLPASKRQRLLILFCFFWNLLPYFQIICFCELISLRCYQLLNVKDEDSRCLTSPVFSFLSCCLLRRNPSIACLGLSLNLTFLMEPPFLIHAPGPPAQRPLVQPFQGNCSLSRVTLRSSARPEKGHGPGITYLVYLVHARF